MYPCILWIYDVFVCIICVCVVMGSKEIMYVCMHVCMYLWEMDVLSSSILYLGFLEHEQ